MVGRRGFAVAIHAGSDEARLDWRSDYASLTYQPVDCPPAIAASAARFLNALGLRFGAFDFAVSQDGTWWFLECNGAGQWGWLAEECDLPIAAAIADDLTEETSR